jgi:hypothetical protein
LIIADEMVLLPQQEQADLANEQRMTPFSQLLLRDTTARTGYLVLNLVGNDYVHQ